MVTEKEDWEGWVLYMLDMVEQTALKGNQRINEINITMVTIATLIKNKLPKIYSTELIHTIFKLPYTKRAFLVNAGLGNLKTVGNYLNELENAGFLRSEQVGKEKLYLNTALMKVLRQ
jgi:hypothetical protein